MPKPRDPYPTIKAIDARLTIIAGHLRRDLMPSYERELRTEANRLLDRRLTFTTRELVQTG